MLRLFFNRFSKVAYTLEIAGVVLTAFWAYRQILHPPSLIIRTLFSLYLLEYVALRFFSTKRWYRRAKPYEGIELHFKKVMVPTAYILAIVSGAGLFTKGTVLLAISIFIFGLILYVNFTLLYLHYKDPNKTPVNYFSHSKHI